MVLWRSCLATVPSIKGRTKQNQDLQQDFPGRLKHEWHLSYPSDITTYKFSVISVEKDGATIDDGCPEGRQDQDAGKGRRNLGRTLDVGNTP